MNRFRSVERVSTDEHVQTCGYWQSGKCDCQHGLQPALPAGAAPLCPLLLSRPLYRRFGTVKALSNNIKHKTIFSLRHGLRNTLVFYNRFGTMADQNGSLSVGSDLDVPQSLGLVHTQLNSITGLLREMQSSHTALVGRVDSLDERRESGGEENSSVLDYEGSQSLPRESSRNISTVRRQGGGVRRRSEYIGTRGTPEGEASEAVEENARADGERGLGPERESVFEFDISANVSGIPPFRQTVPKFSGKRADFARYQHEFINFAKGEGLDWVFVLASDSTRDIDVGDPGLTVEYLGRIHGKDMVAAHVRARRLLVASLEGKREQEILLRLHSPGAVWRKLADMFRPKTNGARLALMEKFENVKISVRDDPEQKLLEMEDIARDLNSFTIHSHDRLSEDTILLRFVNALPSEYEIQIRLIADKEEPLTREGVLTSVRKRFESASFKQAVTRGKKSSPGDQALFAKGGARKPSGKHRKGIPAKPPGPCSEN